MFTVGGDYLESFFRIYSTSTLYFPLSFTATPATVMSESGNGIHTSSSANWDSTSAVYASTAEHVTRPVAEELVSWLNSQSPFSAPGVTAFDNGCGSGVVTATLSIKFPTIPILAADFSPGMLDVVEKKKFLNVRTRVLDATDLDLVRDDTFTHSLSTFMIQFTSDPPQALRELYRVTRPGGALGLGMWGELCFDAPWVEACRHFDPDYTYPHTWSPD